eukprot:NODE_316_length_9983_cov_1.089741.p10 type:complete len:128 gc:universal NODE_316_length_9983_cov_1.089741:1-384(+)
MLYYLFKIGFQIYCYGKLPSLPLEKDRLYFIDGNIRKGKFLGLKYASNVLRVVNKFDVNFFKQPKREYNRIVEYKMKDDEFPFILNLLKDQGYLFYCSFSINGSEIDSDYWIFLNCDSSQVNLLSKC